MGGVVHDPGMPRPARALCALAALLVAGCPPAHGRPPAGAVEARSSASGFKPPGPCVAPVPTAEREGDTPEVKRLDLDLDHDGAPDAAVAWQGDCDGRDNCAYTLYVMRGACGHRVGQIDMASELKAGDAVHAGLADVDAMSPHHDGYEHDVLEFDGTSYRQTLAEECSIGEESGEESCAAIKP